MKQLFILFYLCVSFNTFTQNLWFANSTSDATSESLDIKIDSEGNSYIIGYISGDTEFQNFQLDINLGYSDVVVAKINPLGVYEWVKKFSGPYSDKGLKIDLTSNNELIILGTFYGSIIFDNISLIAQNNSKDIFLAKLDNNGNVIWAKSEGGALGDNPYGLTLDSQDNIIITGQYEGTSTIGLNTFTSTTDLDLNLPSFDMFLAKYNTDGNPLWSKSSHGKYEDRGIGLVCDNLNNIYLIGQFSDTIDFFGDPIANQITNANFISKLSPTGDKIWFDKISAGQIMTYDIKMNSQNELLITGDFQGQLVIWNAETFSTLNNNYSKSTFLINIHNNGEYNWGTSLGSNNDLHAQCLCVDSLDHIYVAGDFKCNFDEFRDSTGTGYWQSVGANDHFITKYNNDGTIIWKNQVGGQKEDKCWAIAIHDVDQPILTGSYSLNQIFPFQQIYFSYSLLSNQNLTIYHDILSNFTKFIYIEGDESSNIFVSKMTNSNSKYYNYYINNLNDISIQSDSIGMRFYPDVDSAFFCPFDYNENPNAFVSLKTNTNQFIGPIYFGSWSNGQDWNSKISTSSITDDYYCSISRVDQCYSHYDEIYIEYYLSPELPLLTDNFSINYNNSEYETIQVCPNDTAKFSFYDVCTNCTVYLIKGNQLVEYHPDSIYTSVHDEQIQISIISDHGCENSSKFKINFQDSIIPYFNYQLDQMNDTFKICSNNQFRVVVLDSITNPNGSFSYHLNNLLLSDYNLTITRNNQAINAYYFIVGRDFFFNPTQDGWYKIQMDFITGLVNCQTPYSIIDSIYINVFELPTILGGNLLCPDSYNFLSPSFSLDSMSWSGPGILWTSSDNDSIKINESGYYQLFSPDLESYNCLQSISIMIQEKQAPLIISNPVDGLICPGSSVLLSLNASGSSYNWLGPEGNTVATSSSVSVINQGYYACIFTDYDGCQLLTNQYEVREYSTPFIEIDDAYSICNFTPIDLTIVFNGLATINWGSPINSSQNTVTISQPGIYYCSASQCGVTVIDSVEIIDGAFDFEIQKSDFLCENEEIQLSIPSNLVINNWSNGSINQSNITVNTEGVYFVDAYNQYNCFNQDTILIDMHVPSQFSLSSSKDTLCYGEALNVSGISIDNVNFYWTDGITSWNTNNLIIDYDAITSTHFQLYNINEFNCMSDTLEYTVEISTKLDPKIQTDSIICDKNELYIYADSTFGKVFWEYPNGDIDTANLVHFNEVNPNNQGIYQATIIDHLNCLYTDSTSINILPLPIFDLGNDTVLCIDYAFNVYRPSVPNIAYVWYDNSSSEYFVPDGKSIIGLTATDEFGCTFSDSILIIYKDCSGQTGNIFTPNEDGKNDFFIIENAEYAFNNCLTILNRWGNVVYQTQAYRNEFNGILENGEKLSEGVYFFLYYKECESQSNVTHQGYFTVVY